ncbi:MAG: hypothetical protein LBR10_01825 [Prevotellaceae bacterium]|jgi:hypothetical protein|nr:hypothetical protein [Prevotellaceae bacterium]
MKKFYFQWLYVVLSVSLLMLAGCDKKEEVEKPTDKELTVEQRSKDFDSYSKIVDKIFENENPTKEMFLAKVAEIERMESVEKVYVNDYDCMIKIIDGPAFCIIYKELPSVFEDEGSENLIKAANDILSQSKIVKADNSAIKIAVFNLNSDDKDRERQNMLVNNTVLMLKNAGCTVDYFTAKQCDYSNYSRIMADKSYKAVYFSAHGVYREDYGYGVIMSNEFVEKGLFEQNWNTGMTDEQIRAEMWHSKDTYIWHPASDKWWNNKFYKAYPVGALKENDGGAYAGRLFYFASCGALKTKNSNYWNGFSGSIAGWKDKNVVGEAVGAIMFYRMIKQDESLVAFSLGFNGKTDPVTGALWTYHGATDFKFRSNAITTNRTYTNNITTPKNGYYIKTWTEDWLPTLTIKGAYDKSLIEGKQPYILLTDINGREIGRENVSCKKDGTFSKTLYARYWKGLVNFTPRISDYYDLSEQTVSVIFSRNFKENYVDEADWTELEDCPIASSMQRTFPFEIGDKLCIIKTDYSIIESVYSYDIHLNKWVQHQSPINYEISLADVECYFQLNNNGYIVCDADSYLKIHKYDLQTNSWSNITTNLHLPGLWTHGAKYFAINNKLYVLYESIMYETDLLNNTYITKNNFPANIKGMFNSVNRGYAMTDDGKIFEYNPVSDIWTEITTFELVNNGNFYYFAANGNFLYFHYSTIGINELWRYSINEKEWEQICNQRPNDAYYAYDVFLVDNNIYALQGSNRKFYKLNK